MRNKLKITITFIIFFIMTMIFQCNVMAKDLRYEAIVDFSSVLGENKRTLTYANYVQSYSPGDGQEISYKGKNIWEDLKNGNTWYNTCGIIFHKRDDVNNNNNGSFQLFYDKSIDGRLLSSESKGIYKNEYEKAVGKGSLIITPNSGKTQISEDNKFFTIDKNTNVLDGNNTLVNIASKVANHFAQNRFEIGPETLKALTKAMQSNIKPNGNAYTVKFSNVINYNGNQYYTFESFLHAMGNGNGMKYSDWDIRNFGLWRYDIPLTDRFGGYSGYNPEGNSRQYFKSGSILNQFDNEMVITGMGQERSVFVQHRVDEGNGEYKIKARDTSNGKTAINTTLTNDTNTVYIQDEYKNRSTISKENEAKSGAGWSEQYKTNDGIQTTNMLSQLGSEYELEKYEIVKCNSEVEPDEGWTDSKVVYTVYAGDGAGLISNNDTIAMWNDGDYHALAVAEDDKSQPQNYGVIYYYKKIGRSVNKIIVGHSEYSSKNSTYEMLMSNKISQFMGKENVTNYTSNKDSFDGWMKVYEFTNSSINVKIPSGLNGYTCVGYKLTRLPIQSYNSKQIRNNMSNSYTVNTYNSSGVKAESGYYTMIIFLYSKGGNIEDSPNINVNAWLDYMSNDSAYRQATISEYNNSNGYMYNNVTNIINNFRNTADVVPSDGKLKPYIRTAPFVILGINSGKSNKISTTVTATQKVTVSYTKSTKDAEGNPSTESTSTTATVKRTINVDYYKYKINNLTLYGINNVNFDNNINYYGKFFEDKNNEFNFKTNTYRGKVKKYEDNSNDKYEDTSKDYAKTHFTLNLSGTTASAPGVDPSNTVIQAAAEAAVSMSSLEYTIYDDDIKVEIGSRMYDNILASKVHEGTVSSGLTDNGTVTINSSDSLTTNNNGKNYNELIKEYMQWNTEARLKEMTKDSDYNSDYCSISKKQEKENGVRILGATVDYKKKVISEGSQSYKPTLYSTASGPKVGTKSINFNTAIPSKMNIEINNKTTSSPKSRKIDIYDPIRFGDWSDMVETENTIDSSTGDATLSLAIQPNVPFTVRPNLVGNFTGVGGYRFNTQKLETYVNNYFISFNFDVKHLKDNKTYSPGEKIPIRKDEFNNKDSFRFVTTDDFKSLQARGKSPDIRIIAVSNNSTKSLKNLYDSAILDYETLSFRNYSTNYQKFIDNIQNKFLGITGSSSIDNQSGYLNDSNVTYSSNHAATTILSRYTKIKTLFRIYDFAVTDCSDLAYKELFRKTENGKVNESTSLPYWSGIRKLQIISSQETPASNNTLIDRTNLGNTQDGIGSSKPYRTIPLGPYKNYKQTNMIQAPKLGYRISYDLKTTGKIEDYNDRKIVIIPRYYYISKDGQNYYKPEEIKLFYKNAFGFYKELSEYEKNNFNQASIEKRYTRNSGAEYSISYTPNDGYRYLRNSSITNNISNLTNKQKKLNISKMILTADSMTTDDNYIQAWYGEFKLPNSTIAVKEENGKYDVNKPLKDGYIGVIFDIYCVDSNGTTLFYAQDDRDNAGNPIDNESQWDFEGFLGFKRHGNKISANEISLQLEKGNWTINDNEIYNEIKGTVILYDIDDRAANDFN